MHTKQTIKLIVFLALGIWLSGCGDSKEKTDFKHIERQAKDMAQKIKEFTFEKKRLFFLEAETALENTAMRIEALEMDLEKRWNKMSRAAKKRAMNRLDTLKEKQKSLSDEVSNLEMKSYQAWDEISKKFRENHKNLKNDIDSAWKEIQTT